MPGRERSRLSLELSFQAFWLPAHLPVKNKAPGFAFCFANITTDTLAKGKRTEPLLSSVEIVLSFLLNTNKALHKNKKVSQEQEFPEISC